MNTELDKMELHQGQTVTAQQYKAKQTEHTHS